MEHSYALNCNETRTSAPDARLLLVRRPPLCPSCHSPTPDDEEDIDIETVVAEPTPPLLLDELPPTEKAIEPGQIIPEAEDNKPDWEQKLYSLAWDHPQIMLIEETLKIVFNTRAALLGCGLKGTKRAACRGIAGRSMRALMASSAVRWQPRLVQWLHNVMSEQLPPPLLAVYREILIALKSKIPTLIEKMTLGHPLMGRIRGAENGSGGPTIASGNLMPSDPMAPYLLLMPSGRDKKDARWAERLRTIAQVHQVHSHQSNWPATLPIPACLSQLVGSGRSRANSIKAENPHRPLVLVGHGVGAAIAVQLAVSISDVAGVVCLGLPLLTADGPRGAPDDCILDLHCPVLFVIGQNAINVTQDDVEALRSRLRCKSRILVVGGADEHLRVSRLRRHLEGVTQRMVESAIAEEVGNFLSSLNNWEDENDGRSTPDSAFDEPESERIIPPIAPANPSVKRRFPETSLYQKTKKLRAKPLKSAMSLKGRGVALYQINNPPPEGTKISMGQLGSTKIVDEEFIPDSGNSLSPPSIKTENASFIQISNNRLKTVPLSGNGASVDKIGSSGIKVLENIPFKMSKLSSSKVLGSLTAPANTTIVLPRKSAPLVKIEPEQTTSSFNPTNIMDIPIIFADDNKVEEKQNQVTTTQIGSIGGMKTFIINKSQTLAPGQIKTIDASQISQAGNQQGIFKLRMSSPTSSGGQLPNNTIKYTKFILKKPNTSEPGKTSLITKPIFVTGKSPQLATIKVVPGSVRSLNQNFQAILKVPASGNASKPSNIVSVDSSKKKTELILENSNTDKAIEAAVASITGDQDNM